MQWFGLAGQVSPLWMILTYRHARFGTGCVVDDLAVVCSLVAGSRSARHPGFSNHSAGRAKDTRMGEIQTTRVNGGRGRGVELPSESFLARVGVGDGPRFLFFAVCELCRFYGLGYDAIWSARWGAFFVISVFDFLTRFDGFCCSLQLDFVFRSESTFQLGAFCVVRAFRVEFF